MHISAKKFIGVTALTLIASPFTVSRPDTATSRIVAAANNFLSSLNEKQRQSVLYAFDDEKQRATWSNFPTSFVPRGGIPLKDDSRATLRRHGARLRRPQRKRF